LSEILHSNLKLRQVDMKKLAQFYVKPFAMWLMALLAKKL
jgi:hypothetical protein